MHFTITFITCYSTAPHLHCRARALNKETETSNKKSTYLLHITTWWQQRDTSEWLDLSKIFIWKKEATAKEAKLQLKYS